MKKLRLVSIRRLKVHEIKTTLRYLNKDSRTWVSQTKIYNSIQKNAISSFIKMAGQILLSYLIISSLKNGPTIILSLPNFEASVPAAYFLFAASFLLLASSLSFNHLVTAMALKNSIAGRMILPGFSVGAYDTLSGDGENNLGVPTFFSSFFKEAIPISAFLGGMFLLALGTALIPFAAFGVLLFSEQIEIFRSAAQPIQERLSALAGAIIVVGAALQVLLFNAPIPLKKNTRQIRWGFLFRLPPHPSDRAKFDRWIDE